jgi:prepilin-type N-terminal cleavage/methylation domain-containing protein
MRHDLEISKQLVIRLTEDGVTTMTQRRRGFTLVEVLVAMALTIFILAILSQAFVTGADTFRTLKAIGDMNASLRTAATIMRDDLSADHFEGKRRLSDSVFWTIGPPEQGYFYLYQGPAAAPEGFDANQVPTYRVTTHKMAFTRKAKGTRQQDFFTATDPNNLLGSIPNAPGRYQGANTFSSQWIEVCYFLAPVQGASTADGTPLYALYRQQRLVVGDNGNLNWGGGGVNRVAWTAALLNQYQPLYSCMKNPNTTAGNNNFLYFNSPEDLTIPERRTATAFTPLTSGGVATGNDLLLTDVISFDIKVLVTQGSWNNLFIDLADAKFPKPTEIFDTWSRRHDDVYDYSAEVLDPVTNTLQFAQKIPMAVLPTKASPRPNPTYRILALQITLRIWDPRTKLSRQISIVQEM